MKIKYFLFIFVLILFFNVSATSTSAAEESNSSNLEDEEIIIESIQDLTVQNLTAKTLSSTSINLSWSELENATSYEIYQSVNPNSGFQLIANETSTSYTIKNLTPGTTNYFKVRAVQKNEEQLIYSQYSDPVSAVTTKLTTPSNLKVTTKTNTSISLSWSQVANAEGYEILMATSKDGKYTKISTPKSTTTTFKHTKLTPNKTYYYKIRSYVKVNNKTYYSSFSSITTGKPTLSTVKSLKTTHTLSTIKLSWGTVSGATGYKVYRSTSKNGTYKLLTTTKNNSYTDKSVTKQKTYYYKVVATRTVGKNVYNSASSSVISGITALEPKLYGWAVDEIIPSTGEVGFVLENQETKTLKILGVGVLIDGYIEDYDRLLQLIDFETYNKFGTYEDLEWQQIGAKQYDFVFFRVVGSNTWYDQNSTIVFYFTYDGVEYIGAISKNNGFTYVENK